MAFARLPYNTEQTWPSELADGGQVGWKRFHADKDGWVNVSYPEVRYVVSPWRKAIGGLHTDSKSRWDQLRADHGWAALQYSVILRTTVDIQHECHASQEDKESNVSVLVDAIQATEYAFIPQDATQAIQGPVTWYNGDVYALAETDTGKRDASEVSNFARSITLRPGKHTLLVKAMYEVRMFGDPAPRPPVIRCKVQMREDEGRAPQIVPGIGSLPNVVDGRIMGDWMSIGVRVPPHGGGVSLIKAVIRFDPHKSVKIFPVEDVYIAPGQTRIAPLRIVQYSPVDLQFSLSLTLMFEDQHGKSHCSSDHPLFQKRSTTEPFKITFASPSYPTSGLPAQIGYAVVVPPKPSDGGQADMFEAAMKPVILATHGAGVDIGWDLWQKAMPKVGAWCVLPTGKNEWGEDWHGASMADAWAAREALGPALARLCFRVSDKTL